MEKNSEEKSTSNKTSENNNEENWKGTWQDFNLGCDDILGGFQKLSPELFVVIGEILANVISGRIPFNVQNAIGNWLQLVGQIIETYNAQQQYFQGGPGRYYNTKYYNVSNPFCQDGSTTEGSSSSGRYSENGHSSDNIDNLKNELKNLEKQIKEMKDKIESLEKGT